jgi:beta-mannosidase
MFANGMYPVTPSFLANVRVEAEQQVKRLRNHPSLALWCGNNEIREGWENWGWQRQMGYSPADSAAVWTGYVQLFDQLLPSIVDSLDPGVFYHESSPTIGWGHPESMTTDDSHYWGVWWGGQPFDTLRTLLPRFMSEFGFQAYPPLPTIASFTQPGDRAVGSTVMDAHQKNAMGDSTIQAYMARWFRPPQSFDRFVYLSQVLQAEGLKIAFEAQRRAMPRTMGTLYWQLDDTWPVVSWSGRDYYGRWKALQYYVRRAFAPLLVSPALEHDSVRVYVVSDRLTPVQGTLTVRTLTFDGRELYTTTSPVTLPADTSIVALSVPLAEALGRHATGGTAGAGGRDAAAEADSSDVVLVAELTTPADTTRDLLYFARPKHQRLPDPQITTQVQRDGDDLVITVAAKNLARDVHLWFEGVEGRMSDDFFDLLPGESRVVRFTPAAPLTTVPRLGVETLRGRSPQ